MKPMPDYIIVTRNSKDYLLRAVRRVFFPFFSSFFQLGKYSFDFPVTSPLLPRSIPDILSNSLLFGTIATFRLSLCQILNLLLKNKLH